MPQDTIVALATGPGRAAVAIVRISGPAAGTALSELVGRALPPRRAELVTIRDPATGETIDRGIGLWFPAPRSFTGEDCAELQIHGSRAVLAALLAALSQVPGCRLAEAGEFTRRAFLNGKLDLAAVEGLADLIDAETESQRRQALRHLDGHLGRWIGELREQLLDAIALTESAIDFADEADIATDAFDDARARAIRLAAAIAAELGRPASGERIREGFVVTIAGPPNAGKSTLLNALARREAAIVSPHAGTTRDPIEVDLDLGGYAVRVIDTAGIRETADPVEQEGVVRARARAASADLVLWLQPAMEHPKPSTQLPSHRLWRIGTKADLATQPAPGHDLLLAVATNAGVDTLVARLQTHVAGQLGGETALVTRSRHRDALQAAEAAASRAATHQDPELAAEDLRAANRALGRIIGVIDVEDVLGAIFSRFCIGK